MKTKMKTVSTNDGAVCLNKERHSNCDIASQWAKDNPGKFAHVSIGKGRMLAFHYNGTLTIMNTTSDANFPPKDCIVVDGIALENNATPSTQITKVPLDLPVAYPPKPDGDVHQFFAEAEENDHSFISAASVAGFPIVSEIYYTEGKIGGRHISVYTAWSAKSNE